MEQGVVKSVADIDAKAEGQTALRAPIFIRDIDKFGEYLWVEFEGYDKMGYAQVGQMGHIEPLIMGWKCKTLKELFQKQREVNYAPRRRFWRGENAPSKEERDAGEWRNDERAWLMDSRWSAIDDGSKYEEYCRTGRTQWPYLEDPEDPVELNAQLAAAGKEPLAPMCAGCHWGKWKDGMAKRWYEERDGMPKFYPCTNISTTGWDYWSRYQEQPPACSHFCRIGE